MAKNSSNNPFISFLLLVIAALLALFYALFSPEHTPVQNRANNQTIPVGSASISKPGDIQGTSQSSQSLQNAATVKPGDLHAVSF